MDKVKNISFLQRDFALDKTKHELLKLLKNKIDIVISDMAADTTGNKSLDCFRTNLLSLEVIEYSLKILIRNGKVISKLFMGEDFLTVKKLAEEKFKKVNFYKPESSRSESKETYIHCANLNTL